MVFSKIGVEQNSEITLFFPHINSSGYLASVIKVNNEQEAGVKIWQFFQFHTVVNAKKKIL